MLLPFKKIDSNSDNIFFITQKNIDINRHSCHKALTFDRPATQG